ncbi:MAG: hypothetical protein WC025_02525 [Candidatus Magasanikbacteria bacterium]
MLLQSTKGKDIRGSLILVILFLSYWLMVFFEDLFQNSFLDSMFLSIFWQSLKMTLKIIAIFGSIFVIVDLIQGFRVKLTKTESVISSVGYVLGIIFVLSFFFLLYILSKIKG